MTLYVDTLTCWNRDKVPTCHLSTDDHSPAGIDALHAMAEMVGQKRTAMNTHHWLYPHYTLSRRQRRRAVLSGCKQVDNEQLVLLCGREWIVGKKEG